MQCQSYRKPIGTSSVSLVKFRALDLHSLLIRVDAACTISFDRGSIDDGIPYQANESFGLTHLDFDRTQLKHDDFVEIYAVAAVATVANISIIRR